jgi:hypothetical protein
MIKWTKIKKIPISIIMIFCFVLAVYVKVEGKYVEKNNATFGEFNKGQSSNFYDFENKILFGKAGKDITELFFPNLNGSNFNLNSLEELMNNPQFRAFLIYLTNLVLSQKTNKKISDIFDEDGVRIFIEAMTLCIQVAPKEKVFQEGLKYANGGTPDYNVLNYIGKSNCNGKKSGKKMYLPNLYNGKNRFLAKTSRYIEQNKEQYQQENTKLVSHKIISIDIDLDTQRVYDEAVICFYPLIQLQQVANKKKYEENISNIQPELESFGQAKEINLVLKDEISYKNRQILSEDEIRRYVNGMKRNLRHPTIPNNLLSNKASNLQEDERPVLVNSMIIFNHRSNSNIRKFLSSFIHLQNIHTNSDDDDSNNHL